MRLWAAISCFAGLLERRVYTTSKIGPVYPNLFVLLVTPPGVGKSLLIDPVARIWRQIKDLHVAPDNMSKAAFLDVLQASSRALMTSEGPLIYHALNAASSEFGNLCPQYEMEYLSVLTRVFDCGDTYRDFKRSREGNQIEIVNPHLNLVAGSQPDYLSQFLPEAAWGQGFMARIIMVHSGDRPKVTDMFDTTNGEDLKLKSRLIEGAKSAMLRIGNVEWTADARALFNGANAKDFMPVPEHSKLKHYSTRRPFYILKLALISALAHGWDRITQLDVTRAIVWLTDAEATMPEIFKAMKGNSDYALLQELQLHVAQLFMAADGKPLAETRLVRFLSERTVAWNIPKIIEAAEKAGLISRVLAGNGMEMWKPGEGKLGPET